MKKFLIIILITVIFAGVIYLIFFFPKDDFFLEEEEEIIIIEDYDEEAWQAVKEKVITAKEGAELMRMDVEAVKNSHQRWLEEIDRGDDLLKEEIKISEDYVFILENLLVAIDKVNQIREKIIVAAEEYDGELLEELLEEKSSLISEKDYWIEEEKRQAELIK